MVTDPWIGDHVPRKENAKVGNAWENRNVEVTRNETKESEQQQVTRALVR